MSVYERLEALNIELPQPPKPVANYIPLKRVGTLIFASGQDCRKNGIFPYKGKIGRDLTVEEGYQAARKTMVNLRSVLHAEIGDLNRIEQFVNLLGFVNSTEEFTEQPAVMNGASDLLDTLFGKKGKHARTTISVNALPFNLKLR